MFLTLKISDTKNLLYIYIYNKIYLSFSGLACSLIVKKLNIKLLNPTPHFIN